MLIGRDFIVFAAICVLSITAFVFLGYSIGRYVQMIEAQNDVEFVPDVNPEVCSVDIDEINEFELRGHIGEKHVRIRYGGNVVMPDKYTKNGRNFTIQY